MGRRVRHTPVRRERGFSLIEVLVVLAIIGVMTALAGLGMGAVGATADGLVNDARRLAQLFPAAQAQARASGQTVVWTYDAAGYRFVLLPRTLLLPADRAVQGGLVQPAASVAQGILRARAWQASNPVRVQVTPAGGARFDGEWMPPPMTVALNDGATSVAIARAGDGRYTVLHTHTQAP